MASTNTCLESLTVTLWWLNEIQRQQTVTFTRVVDPTHKNGLADFSVSISLWLLATKNVPNFVVCFAGTPFLATPICY